jgi:DNA topoisomerase-3
MAEIARFTSAIVDGIAEAPIDSDRLGECPRCGLPVIEGKRGFGCSGWKEGCSFVLWREFEGLTLDLEQIRELLQRGVLARPVTLSEVGEAVLRLADSGDLLPIPVPRGRPRPVTVTASAKGGSPRGSGRSRSTSKADQGGKAAGSAPGPGRRPRASGKEFAAVPVGPCPRCGSEVVEQPKSWGCSKWKEGCSFAIWKSMSGKRITARIAKMLLTKGRTSSLKGFKSKAGKPFEASLVLENGDVRFDFGSPSSGGSS